MPPPDPTALHNRVELERSRIALAHASGNLLNLMLGALLITGILYQSGASIVVVVTWLSLFTLLSAGMLRYERYIDKVGVWAENFRELLQGRIIFGSGFALFYGAAAFLLPHNTSPVLELLLFFVLSTLVTLSALSFAVTPKYYYAIDICSMVPLTMHYLITYLLHGGNFYVQMMFISIVWQAMVFQKAERAAKTALEAVSLHQCLEDEISAHEQAREALQHLAHNDALTGIGNRRYFEEVFQRTFNLAVRNHNRFAVMSLDLNDFKPVNDQYGHAVGDGLLKAVAERISETIRGTDFCARTGGDEFSVIFENIREESDVIDIANKLQHKLSQPFIIDYKRIIIGASVGIALFPEDGGSMDELMQVADKKMYHHKQGIKTGNFTKFQIVR